MCLHEAHGGAGWRISPQHVDDRVPAHQYAGVHQEQREHRAPRGRSKGQRCPVSPGLERAKRRQPQSRTGSGRVRRPREPAVVQRGRVTAPHRGVAAVARRRGPGRRPGLGQGRGRWPARPATVAAVDVGETARSRAARRRSAPPLPPVPVGLVPPHDGTCVPKIRTGRLGLSPCPIRVSPSYHVSTCIFLTPEAKAVISQ